MRDRRLEAQQSLRQIKAQSLSGEVSLSPQPHTGSLNRPRSNIHTHAHSLTLLHSHSRMIAVSIRETLALMTRKNTLTHTHIHIHIHLHTRAHTYTHTYTRVHTGGWTRGGSGAAGSDRVAGGRRSSSFGFWFERLCFCSFFSCGSDCGSLSIVLPLSCFFCFCP